MSATETATDYLLMPMGSSGDVFPFLGLGRRLRERGHQVTLATAEPFRETAEQAGLSFVGFGADTDWDQAVDDPDLWHPRKAVPAVARLAILPHLREQAEFVMSRAEAAHTAGRGVHVVHSALGFGARCGADVARQRGPTRLTTIHLQPSTLWSAHESPRLGAGTLMGSWVPRWLKSFQFRLGVRLVLDPVIMPGTNAYRRELGLEPVPHTDDMFHSPEGCIGLWPEWYGAPQPDWPVPVSLAHFPLWDTSDLAELDPELTAWLDAGDPPLAFTFGTAMRHGEAAFAAAAAAAERLGRRALLLTRYDDQLPGSLPEGVRHVAFAPFGRLLPRCAALIHHGGIGTASQGLRAGVPQLIMPLAHDQPDNAQRLRRLGVGDELMPNRFRPRALAAKLDALLGSEHVRGACAEVARRFDGADGLERACELLERFAPRA